MSLYIIAYIIIIVILIIYLRTKQNLILVRGSDGKKFYVIDMPDSKKAAEFLSTININISRLLFALKQNHGRTHPMVAAIIGRYNPDVLTEHRPNVFNSSVAYTTNKGEELYICLRNWNKGGELCDFNTIMFVALHELTHIAIKPWGHPTSFWAAFKWVLNDAVRIGIYKPIDYSISPVTYCDGMEIAYNPMFDTKLPNVQ
jgi:hypothetical protein